MAFTLETAKKMQQEKVAETVPQERPQSYAPRGNKRPPGATPGAEDMPCHDCGGKQVDEDGENCEMCAGTGVVPKE